MQPKRLRHISGHWFGQRSILEHDYSNDNKKKPQIPVQVFAVRPNLVHHKCTCSTDGANTKTVEATWKLMFSQQAFVLQAYCKLFFFHASKNTACFSLSNSPQLRCLFKIFTQRGSYVVNQSENIDKTTKYIFAQVQKCQFPNQGHSFSLNQPSSVSLDEAFTHLPLTT